MKRHNYSLPCPVSPDHGPLLAWEGSPFYCPHDGHDPKPGVIEEPPRRWFTVADMEAARG